MPGHRSWVVQHTPTQWWTDSLGTDILLVRVSDLETALEATHMEPLTTEKFWTFSSWGKIQKLPRNAAAPVHALAPIILPYLVWTMTCLVESRSSSCRFEIPIMSRQICFDAGGEGSIVVHGSLLFLFRMINDWPSIHTAADASIDDLIGVLSWTSDGDTKSSITISQGLLHLQNHEASLHPRQVYSLLWIPAPYQS